MSAPNLKEALRLVETLGIAPLARVHAAHPSAHFATNPRTWDRYRAAMREVETRAIEQLAAHGARIRTGGSAGTRVRFVGVTASSTIGLDAALRHWKAAAEKRLREQGGRP